MSAERGRSPVTQGCLFVLAVVCFLAFLPLILMLVAQALFVLSALLS